MSQHYVIKNKTHFRHDCTVNLGKVQTQRPITFILKEGEKMSYQYDDVIVIVADIDGFTVKSILVDVVDIDGFTIKGSW